MFVLAKLIIKEHNAAILVIIAIEKYNERAAAGDGINVLPCY